MSTETIDSLDSRIRKKARRQAEIEVKAVFDKAAYLCDGDKYVELNIERPGHATISLNEHGKVLRVLVTVRHALALLHEHALSDTAPRREDAAVAEFLSQVNRLMDRLDEVAPQ